MEVVHMIHLDERHYDDFLEFCKFHLNVKKVEKVNEDNETFCQHFNVIMHAEYNGELHCLSFMKDVKDIYKIKKCISLLITGNSEEVENVISGK